MTYLGSEQQVAALCRPFSGPKHVGLRSVGAIEPGLSFETLLSSFHLDSRIVIAISHYCGPIANWCILLQNPGVVLDVALTLSLPRAEISES